MKTIALLIALLTVQIGFSQDLYITKTGEISFFSETPMEDIEAENNSVTCILKLEDGGLAFKLLMKSFLFEKAAMQQHFNDDYVHSDEFPKSTFNGKIIDHDKIDFTADGTHKVKVEGVLNMHGIDKEVEYAGTVTIKDGKISLKSSFDVELSDFDIKVPSNFLKRISNTINISVHATLEPYQR